ncbi:MAG: pyrrolo-quinoline quinone [Polyangiaceae bacterium]
MISKRVEDFAVIGCIAIGVMSCVYACGGDDSTGATSGSDASTDSPQSDDSDGQAGKDGGGTDGSTPSPCLSGNCANVVTEHNDNARTGQYTVETKLTPTNVTMATFGKLFELSVDGKVDAEPLYVQKVMIKGVAHNVIYVVTEHDSVYAFDAETKPDAGTSTLWGPVSMVGAGETPSDAVGGCGQVTPEIGITSTPVIDVATSTIYLVAMSKNGGTYHQRFHALDITTGAEKSGSPKDITATYPGTGQEGNGTTLTFDPKIHKERSALLLDHGQVYLSWSSHCDQGNYTGWIMAYDATTYAQTAVFNDEPNGSEAAFWSSGAGPAADTAGNIYNETGNGGFETTLNDAGQPNKLDYGNSFVKVTRTGSAMTLTDYFTEGNEVSESAGDIDMSSGGLMLLPDSAGSAGHPQLLVGSGKDGHMYLLDRSNLGKFNADGGNGQIVQDIPNATFGPGSATSGTGSFGAPAFFNGAIYYGGESEPLKRWAIAGGSITTPQTSQTAASFQYPGTTPSVSYDGTNTATGIIWAHENSSPPTLHAYNPADLTTEYYNSNQAGLRDQPAGAGNKFIIPTIANGRVYLATQSSIVVFGLL